VQVVVTNPDGRASAASPPTARVADRMVGHAQSVSCRRVKGRARRPPATCRGHRTSARASARARSR
jgi:hypothetical protein